MNEDHVTISPIVEAQWIRDHLINDRGVIVDLVTIMHIVDAHEAYLDHLGLLEEEPGDE